MFDSVEEVQKRLADEQYITDKRVATVVFLAVKMGKPILIEGPAGVGKTELAKVVCSALGRKLIRLQCYEGLDEAKALYEWEYSKQLLYTQILKDKISEVLEDAHTIDQAVEKIGREDNVFFSERFLVPRPLMQAITSEEPVVLLIDEVDKSDPEFEAFLLEVLSDFQVSVPEIGTFKATQIPPVLLTSNNAREMSDALKRRCLHLYIDYPSREQEAQILELKVPGIKDKLAADVVEAIQHIRKLDLKKAPSISESIDWGKALVLLNADTLDEKLVDDTLSLILKYEGDIKKAQEELHRYLRNKNAPEAPATPASAATGFDKTKLN